MIVEKAIVVIVRGKYKIGFCGGNASTTILLHFMPSLSGIYSSGQLVKQLSSKSMKFSLHFRQIPIFPDAHISQFESHPTHLLPI